MKLKSTLFSFLLALLFANNLAAQQAEPLDLARQYAQKNIDAWGLSPQDIDGMTVNDFYTDKKTGISRAFFLQQFQSIPVYNAILTINITKAGEVFFTNSRFVPGLAGKINTTIPVLSAEQAVKKLAAHLGLPNEGLKLKERLSGQSYIFEKGNIAQYDISAKLSIQPNEKTARLAWDIMLSPVNSHDRWSTRVDAVTGEILDEYNWTTYCKVGKSAYSRHDDLCHDHAAEQQLEKTFDLNLAGGGTYNVWPPPLESPNHGPRALMEDPADPAASPFGWHDVDGAEGAEYTITRGNNSHAFLSRSSEAGASEPEPDGGPDLVFDFPWGADQEPQDYTKASVTNLFYWTNYMHDFGWHFGFDEAAGNFQQNTYENGGLGDDAIIARAQAGADADNNNNAFYSHNSDGNSTVQTGPASINMFVWETNLNLTVNAPASVEGLYETIDPALGDWGQGAYVTDVPVTGEVVVVNDGFGSPTDGCQFISNAAEIDGKIALIDRGTCFFTTKALNAQDAGAIGVIICNIPGVDPPGGLGNGGGGPNVQIPVVMLTLNDCNAIRQFVGNGLEVSLVDPGVLVPDQFDGGLDNGIVAHEYGHGISTRLTGGPAAACLNNAEEMGEGWSDWMALITTVHAGDTGEKSRGTGTYVSRESPDGKGIRRFPYSTDMSVNPLTYGDVATSQEVHDLGEVWTTMVWDMYWAFVDKYGWSEDPYDEDSGNFKAVKLVFEGMKTQGCSPGFVTGRDAILAMDQALYGGENQCLIWKVFARRGCGMSADEGSTSDAGDQIEAFDTPCECRDKLAISKSVTPFIEAGDDIEVSINLSNCKLEPVTNVEIRDEIPDGTTYIDGSSNVPVTVQGNTLVFDLGDLSFEDTRDITYSLSTSPDNFSIRYSLDEVTDASSDENWDLDVFLGNSIWQIVDDFGGHTGDYSWYAKDLEQQSDQILFQKESAAWTVAGDRPALRIYHKYNTQPILDGGFIEVKKVGEDNWHAVNSKVLRNDYDNELPFATIALPGFRIWSGFSGDDFEASYIDLSDWIGETIQIRFRFVSDDNTAPANDGWQVDDIEFMDLFSYQSEVCFTTAQGDNGCFQTVDEGTIVESQISTGSTVRQLEDVTITTYPNPVGEVLYVTINSAGQQELSLSLMAVDGKTISQQSVEIQGSHTAQLDVSNVPAGFYFLKISSEKGQLVQKVVVD
ncbi:MAG TPA: T9SS type A sorting domain-containing protein [Bacteroidetes bacterium]|nr:T9SS type A sorting domain-containing protein [Bacteroidota bacterium]